MHSRVTGNVDLIRVAGKDDGYAFADGFSIFAYGYLTDSDPY